MPRPVRYSYPGDGSVFRDADDFRAGGVKVNMGAGVIITGRLLGMFNNFWVFEYHYGRNGVTRSNFLDVTKSEGGGCITSGVV